MNIHIPERIPGESFDAYKQRRIESKAAVRKILQGVLLTSHVGKGLHRQEVKAAGGRRQFRRLRSAPLRALRNAAHI